jgi:hypothetical protein
MSDSKEENDPRKRIHGTFGWLGSYWPHAAILITLILHFGDPKGNTFLPVVTFFIGIGGLLALERRKRRAGRNS